MDLTGQACDNCGAILPKGTDRYRVQITKITGTPPNAVLVQCDLCPTCAAGTITPIALPATAAGMTLKMEAPSP